MVAVVLVVPLNVLVGAGVVDRQVAVDDEAAAGVRTRRPLDDHVAEFKVPRSRPPCSIRRRPCWRCRSGGSIRAVFPSTRRGSISTRPEAVRTFVTTNVSVTAGTFMIPMTVRLRHDSGMTEEKRTESAPRTTTLSSDRRDDAPLPCRDAVPVSAAGAVALDGDLRHRRPGGEERRAQQCQ